MDENKEKKLTYKVVGWTWWSNYDYIDAPLTDDVIEAVAEEIREHGYALVVMPINVTTGVYLF